MLVGGGGGGTVAKKNENLGTRWWGGQTKMDLARAAHWIAVTAVSDPVGTGPGNGPLSSPNTRCRRCVMVRPKEFRTSGPSPKFAPSGLGGGVGCRVAVGDSPTHHAT